MYEKHFGLGKSPFPDRVIGADVFVGPQTAAAMAGLRKAFARPDAVVAVSGPAGVGKTALATKTLEALGPSCKAIPIGRMHLSDSDVLEYLLEALGVSKLPNGSVRRFTALRKVLAAVQAQNMRVLVVVEDAMRLGVDTLAELEALTAADAGPSAGANLLLMGNDSLGTYMRDPQLERLSQRLRYRHRVEPMSAPELRGYLKHSFRQCGGDFESIFDKDAVDRLARLGSGIPRVVNNLVEAALTAVANDGDKRVSAARIAAVASEEFGLDLSTPAVGSEKPALIVETGAMAVSRPAPEPAAEEAGSKPDFRALETAQPGKEDDIPDLIQDTLPNLEILTPEYIAAVETRGSEDQSLPTLEPLAEVDPEPASPPEVTTESKPGDVPEWERDPTLAQLKPDFDALEKAMALNRQEADKAEKIELEVARTPDPATQPEEIPEITLDSAIKKRVVNNLIDEPGQISPSGSHGTQSASASDDLPEVKLAPARTKKADAELERIAAELAKAKTVEQVDGMLVETLFGEEINLVAAQVVTNGHAARSANDGDLGDFETLPERRAPAAGEPNGTARDSVEVSLETPRQSVDLSASQRLKTVRALSADARPSTHRSGPNGANAAGESSRNYAAPASIEDQINTSMTQTLKALDVRPPLLDREELLVLDAEDEEDEQKKGGFFSRFRRS